MRRKTVAIFVVVICTVFTTAGQLLLKMGTSSLSPSIASIITNVWLILGMVLYGIGAFLLIIALKYGELSVIYPIISLSFVWVTLVSVFFLHESVSPAKLAGIFFILFGVSFIGIGGRRG